MNVENKVVVVAGGASGLGRAAAEHLHGHGAQIAVLDRDENAARDAASGLNEAIGIGADVTSGPSVEKAVAEVVGHFGAVHVNVNTAGIPDGARVVSKGEPAPLEGFEQVVAVNLVGTFNVMRVAIGAMLCNELDAGERGVVINTASVAAFDGQVGQAAYSASKAGVVGMALPVARDLAGMGVRVNTIAPGIFETPLTDGLPAKVVDNLSRWILQPRRAGRPDEFAGLVRHIVENSYLNAECIRLDAATRLNVN